MVTIGSVAIEEHLIEELAFLWNVRNASTHAPNFRLIDLGRLDERLAAHLDAIILTGQAGWTALALADRQTGDIGVAFVAASAAVAGGGVDQFNHVVEWSGVAEPEAAGFREFVSALAGADRNAAITAVERLRNRSEPGLQAAWLAALGARRSDPGPRLTVTLSDPVPLVRARAYRTAGQLGRADVMAQIRLGLTDDDSECRFWSAWSAARMGARGEPLDVLADIAWNNHPRAVRALDLLLRRLDVPQANSWLREFAKLPGRQRDLIRATGVIGDPLYIPWLVESMATLETTRLAGEAFSMITGVDLAYRDLDRKPPQDFESGPNDDPADEYVSLDEDERLPWPDAAKVGDWWTKNKSRFSTGAAYFLGKPKASADWLEALSDAFQRQRHAAALELAIRQPNKAMFEVRARGRLQRQLLAGAGGKQ
jgi:uncharacterized protein (TIGR02270 family)